MIVFEKCNSTVLGRACKTEDEINDWLRFKYIVALENERFFVQDKFDEERIAGVSHLSWYSITPLGQRSDYVRMINLSDVVLNDDIYDVASKNEETEMAFTFGDSAEVTLASEDASKSVFQRKVQNSNLWEVQRI